MKPLLKYFNFTRTAKPASKIKSGYSFQRKKLGLLGLLTAAQAMYASIAIAAPVQLTLDQTFVGKYGYKVTGATRRTQPNTGNACSVLVPTTTNTASLSLPAGGTVVKAFLYWTGSTNSQANADWNVTFEGQSISAPVNRRYYLNYTGDTTEGYFNGRVDVTSIVQNKGSGTYSFSDLTVNTGAPHCSFKTVLAGWELIVIYQDNSLPNTAVNLYDGFVDGQNTSFNFTLDKLAVTNNPIASMTTTIWEGDPDLSNNEALRYDGGLGVSTLASGPFDSNSTALGSNNTYGFDADTYNVSSLTQAGVSQLTGTVQTGQDYVFLNNVIIAATTQVADLKLEKTVDNATPNVGQNITFTVNVTNEGPDTTNNVTVKDLLPTGVSHVSNTGGGNYNPTTGVWNTGTLTNGQSKSLQITVKVNNTGNITNTAEVTGSSLRDPDSQVNNNISTEDDQASVLISAVAPGTITGKVIKDDNSNGAVDTGETGFSPEVTVTLKDSNDNTVGSPVTTAADGTYTFTNVPVGTGYKVVVTPPAGTTETLDPDATKDNQTAGVNVTAGITTTVAPFAYAAVSSNRPLGLPLTCDSTFYITIGNTGGPQQLYDINRSGATFNFIPRGSTTDTTGGYPTKFDYNALAYNPIDNYLYAYINQSSATTGPYSAGNVIKIGSDGVAHSLGKPTGGTLSTGYFAAAMLSDGTYVIGGGNKFATLDVSTTPPTILNAGTISGVTFNDFAVDPRDPASLSGKKVYGVNENGTQDKLIILDVTNFPPTITSQATNPTGFDHNSGSQFVDAFGTLYYRSNSDNKLYRIDTDPNSSNYGKATEVATAPTGGNHDGTSCLFAAGMEKNVQDTKGNSITQAAAGQTVKYVYKIATGNVLDITGVTFQDDLRSVAGGNPINGNFTGNVTVSNGSGNVTFANNNQTLRITNLTLPKQDPNKAGGETLTITAEVIVPNNLTAGTYKNQSFLSNLPSQYPSSIPSDYPSSAAFEDPTSLQVTEPVASNPKLLLVKRITAINGTPINKYVDDTTSAKKDDDNNPNWPAPLNTDSNLGSTNISTLLRGVIDGGIVKPGDELEYTIYFLSSGDTPITNVHFCDLVPDNVTFISSSFTGQTPTDGGLPSADAGIQMTIGNSTNYLTNVADSDRGEYFPPATTPSTSCSASNTNGAVVVKIVNSQAQVPNNTLPNATAAGTPTNSYGFIRFRGRVK
ncbi:DUF6923 family protein [Fischerella sp. PCC 9605]|uniref:DUF6923 family protein n=1 Tax=Fischerella sp. PCC 9605 TaxID=1173024 RepID=UPI00047B747F|nr:DUF11 domain-containing protein [Fischerella sp. PCC 9605]